MNKQIFILIAGGLCAALIVALIVQMLIGEEPSPTVAQQAVPTIEILVAAKPLSIGDTLDESATRWQTWPENAVFPGAVIRSNLDDPDAAVPLEGQVKRPVAEGEPLTSSALVDADKGNFIAATLHEGMRAMAVTVDAETSVGGFVTPGDYVDVILTHSVRLPSDDNIQDASKTVISQMTAQTILEHIRVLAVDQQAKEPEEIKLFKTVTLEVSPKQAEKLALAGAMGDLSLSLRRLGDTAVYNSGETLPEATTDIRMSKVMQELLGDENTSGVTSRIVRIYNGAEVEDMAVRPYPGQ